MKTTSKREEIKLSKLISSNTRRSYMLAKFSVLNPAVRGQQAVKGLG